METADIAKELAERVQELVRNAFFEVLRAQNEWEPPQPQDVYDEKLRRTLLVQVRTSWGSGVDGRGDPCLVNVFTEETGYIMDPFASRAARDDWQQMIGVLRRHPWVADAAWDSVSSSRHLVQVLPWPPRPHKENL